MPPTIFEKKISNEKAAPKGGFPIPRNRLTLAYDA